MDDNDSDMMPNLQPISDSSHSESDGDTDEVAMMQDFQPVHDENDSLRADDDNNNNRNPDGDDEMPTLEPLDSHPSSHDTQPFFSSADTNRPIDDDDYDSEAMPDLQPISDSSDSESEGDTDEVEMMQDLQPVNDDNDTSWTDDDDEMPALEPLDSRPQAFRRGNRRGRVDDDDDRDHRHPSLRTSNNTNNQPQQPLPQSASQPHPPQHPQHPQFNIPFFVHLVSGGPMPGPNPDGNGDGFQLFQRLFGGALPPFNPNLPQQPGNPPPNANAAPTFAGAFTIPLGPGPLPGAPDGPQPQAHTPANADIPGARPPGVPGPGAVPRSEERFDLAMFGELMARFGQAFGIGRDEQEDPERAKRLVDGLEEVPIGLVRRLERVGGAQGEHVETSPEADGSEETPDVPGCAICWDHLLDPETSWSVPKEESEKVEEDNMNGGNTSEGNTSGGDVAVNMESESSSNIEPPTDQSHIESSSTSLPTSAPMHPKIVSLPCAHVFHATCLLPWFSRPRQTTCPTCRFNIDPENLTYIRKPRPAFATAAGAGNGPMAGDAGAAGAGAGVDVAADTGAGEANVGAQPIHEAHVHVVELDVDGGVDGNQPAPAPAPNVNFNVPPPNIDGPPGGIWTFGIDMVVGEHPENEENDNMDPEDDGLNLEMRRQAELFARAFLGRMGLRMMAGTPPTPAPAPNPTVDASAPVVDDDPPLAPTGTDNAGAQPGGQFPQFFGTGGGGFGADDPAGAEGRGQEPQPQGWGDFTQMFGRAMGGGAGTGANQPAGAPPDPAAGGNMPPGDAQAAFTQFFGDIPLLGPMGPHVRAHGAPPPPLRRRSNVPRERKEWSPPPAPGPTLRQRVEQKEREAGLRCFDMSCGMGPSDEEPLATLSDPAMKQLSIRLSSANVLAGMSKSVCAHTFHPSCLVSAVRVSLRGGEETVVGDEVEVLCPNCRAIGCVSKEEWAGGV